MLTCLHVSETGSSQHSPSGIGDGLQDTSLFGELTNTSCRVLKRIRSSHTSSFFPIIQQLTNSYLLSLGNPQHTQHNKQSCPLYSKTETLHLASSSNTLVFPDQTITSDQNNRPPFLGSSWSHTLPSLLLSLKIKSSSANTTLWGLRRRRIGKMYRTRRRL
jgi:hypothetical protein